MMMWGAFVPLSSHVTVSHLSHLFLHTVISIYADGEHWVGGGVEQGREEEHSSCWAEGSVLYCWLYSCAHYLF